MNSEEQVESDIIVALHGGKILKESQDEEIVLEVHRSALTLKLAAGIILIGLFFIALLIAGCDNAFAEDIDLDKIAQIESSGCKQLVGDGGKSLGCYQIGLAALADVNKELKTTYSHRDMMDKKIARTVAGVYINKIIPRYLKHHKLSDTIANRIIAYNSGIKTLVKKEPIPAITRKYIAKYRRREVNQ